MKNKILVVDDDSELLDLLQTILQSEGYAVKPVPPTNFDEAITQTHPDVLLLDIWFGDEKRGITLAKKVKQDKKFSKTPVILMSSDANVGNYAQQVNAEGYLQKPFDVEELLTKVQRLLH